MEEVIVVVVSILIFMLVIVAAFICIPFGCARQVFFGPVYFWGLVCALRGIRIDVKNSEDEIRIRIQ